VPSPLSLGRRYALWLNVLERVYGQSALLKAFLVQSDIACGSMKNKT